jgi:outer membrane protein assembly factor BamB
MMVVRRFFATVMTALALSLGAGQLSAAAHLQGSTCPAPAAAGTGVAQPGGDGSLAATQPGPAPSAAPALCWTGDFGVPIAAPATVAVGDVIAAANDAGEVVAYDPSGTELWRFAVVEEAGMGQVRGLAAGDGAIYAAGPDGLYAIQPSDGSRLWRYRVQSEGLLPDTNGFFTPAAFGDTVYGVTASTEDDVTFTRTLVAIDAATGDERWSAELTGNPPGAPSANDTTVTVADSDGTLHAYAAADGAELWTAGSDVLGAAPATRAAITADAVVIGLATGEVVALTASDGSEAWRFTADSGTVAALTAVDNVVYVNGVTTLYALDAAAGTANWQAAIQASPPPLVFNAVIPAVVDGTVIVGTTDIMSSALVIAFDPATGTEQWRADTGLYGATFSPVVTGGRVYASAYGLTGGSGLVALG